MLNGVQHIEETILSVAEAKDSSVQYIVIDGGSTDGTLDVIRKYSSFIDHYVSEPDGGIFDAMNKGIRAANGDCIGLLNCGDYYEAGAVEAVMEQLRDCETPYFLIAGGVNMVDDSKGVLSSYIPNEDRIQRRFVSMPVNHPALFVSRAVYRDFGLYDASYKIASDYEFVLRVIEDRVPVHIIHKSLTNMRIGGVSDSWRTLIQRVREHYCIVRQYREAGYCLFVSAREVVAYLTRPLRRKVKRLQDTGTLFDDVVRK